MKCQYRHVLEVDQQVTFIAQQLWRRRYEARESRSMSQRDQSEFVRATMHFERLHYIPNINLCPRKRKESENQISVNCKKARYQTYERGYYGLSGERKAWNHESRKTGLSLWSPNGSASRRLFLAFRALWACLAYLATFRLQAVMYLVDHMCHLLLSFYLGIQCTFSSHTGPNLR